jgi:hypothetical protein
MVGKEYLLNSKQMASFVARGFLRFDELIPDEINQAIMRDIDAGQVKAQPAGTPLSQCYPPPSAVGEMLRLPQVQGIIQSLVGPDPLFDHQAVHVRQPREDSAQHLHGDSTIDIRAHFDIQLMYFPHDVSPEMGGTLILPGSHFRRINEMDIARYQNFVGQIQMVCKAGTLMVVHHGIWHCGRQNTSNQVRYMFKVRLNPAVRQLRLWNTDDLTDDYRQNQTIFGGSEKKDDVQSILGQQEPWFEHADGRLEIINRAKLWRFLTGDDKFDVHYWLTRLENMPERVLAGAE